jgi:hypothetical protein
MGSTYDTYLGIDQGVLELRQHYSCCMASKLCAGPWKSEILTSHEQKKHLQISAIDH